MSINKKQSLLTGKYLVKNPFLFGYLWLTDAFFSLFIRKKKENKTIDSPKKILVSNIAHFALISHKIIWLCRNFTCFCSCTRTTS